MVSVIYGWIISLMHRRTLEKRFVCRERHDLLCAQKDILICQNGKLSNLVELHCCGRGLAFLT